MVVVAVSGQPGCGSSTAAELLAKKLRLKFFSAGSYTKMLAKEKMNINKEQTERILDFWKTRRGKSREHHIAVEDMQARMARKGNIVIEGKLAVHFVGDADLRVWLKAPFEVRAARYVKRECLTQKDATKFLHEKEKDERKNWKRIYGFDYFDQEKDADIVIDTSEKTPEEIVGVIIDFMKAMK